MTTRSEAGGTQVPGPPRGRRRFVRGDLASRIRAARAAEGGGGGSLLRLSGEVILLLKDLATDPRVPTDAKVVAGAAAAYLVSPLDLVPDWIPVVGQVDDMVVVAVAFRRLLTAAGYDTIYDVWRGSDEGLALVLALAGVQD
jgi:uncharacterized membrane protein YkvA (DUF1232 family)